LRLRDGTRPADILEALLRSGKGVERFEKILMPMEDIFIQVVGETRE
jgi:hypothetical protein